MSSSAKATSDHYRPREKARELSSSRLFRQFGYCLALSLISISFFFAPIAQYVEHRFGLGLLFRLRQPIEAPPGALIAAIDRRTIAWLRSTEDKPKEISVGGNGCFPDGSVESLRHVRGPGSAPRRLYACLLNRFHRLGFRAVVFDILFSVPGKADEDAIFAQALKDHGGTALLVGYERYSAGTTDVDVIVERQVEPFQLFKGSAAATGLFVLPRVSGPIYGYWRRVPAFSDVSSLIDQAIRLSADPTKSNTTKKQPEPSFNYLWLYGAPGTIPTISISDVLEQKREDYLRKLAPLTTVFVGASDPTSTNYPDSHPTIYQGKTGANISGVELAATAFLNRRAGHNLQRLPWSVETLLLLSIAFTMSFAAVSTNRYSIVAIPSIAVAFLMGSFIAFAHYRLFVPIVTLVYLAAPINFLIALMVRANIARALIMRLAPAPIARRLLQKAADPRRDVVSNDATVVFFDIIGSTKIGEGLPEVTFSYLINDYHEIVTNAVESHRGFVVAFTGDGVTAVFDKSHVGADHAFQACQAVIAAMRGIRGLNYTNAGQSLPPLASRVGINSGIVAEGGIGAMGRFNFSVVGDVVNLAARLEQLGKTLFPNDLDVVLVGATTRNMADRAGLEFVDCGPQTITGRDSPENVFRLVVD